jgi:hypothetical protein
VIDADYEEFQEEAEFQDLFGYWDVAVTPKRNRFKAFALGALAILATIAYLLSKEDK